LRRVLRAGNQPEIADAEHLEVRAAFLETHLCPMARPIAVRCCGRLVIGPGVARRERYVCSAFVASDFCRADSRLTLARNASDVRTLTGRSRHPIQRHESRLRKRQRGRTRQRGRASPCLRDVRTVRAGPARPLEQLAHDCRAQDALHAGDCRPRRHGRSADIDVPCRGSSRGIVARNPMTLMVDPGGASMTSMSSSSPGVLTGCRQGPPSSARPARGRAQRTESTKSTT